MFFLDIQAPGCWKYYKNTARKSGWNSAGLQSECFNINCKCFRIPAIIKCRYIVARNSIRNTSSHMKYCCMWGVIEVMYACLNLSIDSLSGSLCYNRPQLIFIHASYSQCLYNSSRMVIFSHTMDLLWEKFQLILPLYMKPISFESKASIVCSVTAAIFINFCPKKLNVFSQHIGKKTNEYLNSWEQIPRNWNVDKLSVLITSWDMT